MKTNKLYPIWAGMYILCACLGTVTQRSAAAEVLLTMAAVLFFVPGALILFQAFRKNDQKAVRRVRVISAASLLLTAVLLVVNICVAPAGSENLRNVMELVLYIVSVPMSCSASYFLSMFLWACLLMLSFPRLWRGKSQ